ncbi:hypothetical protein [Hyphomonas sp. KY3]|uniref:hypothetical protein n=1 Tax=Hyphomonas sp. KY3 TaxID=2016196 RepID=UPI001A8F756A|nr:hypothetical protein [Hyphomonas sp. KY3]QSR23186.1 hypothetical protein CFA77_12885 [Hyphomonas sp. KY3]
MMMPHNVVRLHGGGSSPRLLNANAPHARIYADWRHLDAFKCLTPLQRVLLEDMLMDFSRVTGNQVRLTCKGVMQRYRVGHKTAKKAIAGLEEFGWITRIGLSSGPTGQAGGVYEIECITAQGKPIGGRYQTWTKD